LVIVANMRIFLNGKGVLSMVSRKVAQRLVADHLENILWRGSRVRDPRYPNGVLRD